MKYKIEKDILSLNQIIIEGEVMEKSFYCPECKSKLEEITGCGSVGYFCDHCKKLISRKAILTEEQVSKKAVEKEVQQSPTEK